jgi:5'(3')-deoxyribonucleotidase
VITLLDCDGPLSQFTQSWLDAMWEETGVQHHAEEVDRWNIHECEFFAATAKKRGVDPKVLKNRIAKRVGSPGFCSRIEPQPGALEAVSKLAQYSEVFVLTSPWNSPTWMHERAQWVGKHFPMIGSHRVIQTAYKHLVHGHVFVDDKLDHVLDWQAAWPNSEAILFDMHHNRVGTDGCRGGWPLVIESVRSFSVEGDLKLATR